MAALDLAGHFDEAGTHAASSVVVVAGYVAPASDWKELERLWLEALREEGAAFYHTTDIEAQPKPRGIYRDWTREKADRLTDKVVPIAAKYAGPGVGVHVLTKDWYELLPFVKERLPNEPHKVLFQMLARACMELVVESLAPDLPIKEKVAFVFEENDFSDVTLKGYRSIKDTHPRSERFGPLSFQPDKKEAPGIQTADLFAWHYRRLTEIRQGFRSEPVHRCVGHLIGTDFVFRAIGNVREVVGIE
ncbi:MAG: DUF3800 domain-containing protein [Candidatus Binataceae bacterium]